MKKIILLLLIVALSGCYTQEDRMKNLQDNIEYNQKKKEMCEDLGLDIEINNYSRIRCLNHLIN